MTPSNEVDLAPACRALYVTGAGVLALVDERDNVVTFEADARTFLPLGPKRVNATDTTATGIVALY